MEQYRESGDERRIVNLILFRMNALKLFSSTLWGLIPLWQVGHAQSFSYQLVPLEGDVYRMDIMADSAMTDISTLEFEILCDGCTITSQTGTDLLMHDSSWFAPSGNWTGSYSIHPAGDEVDIQIRRTDGGVASGSGYLISLTHIVITIDDFSKRFPTFQVRWKAPVYNDIRWEIYDQHILVHGSSAIQQVEILSMDGKVLKAMKGSILPIDMEPGIYLLRITHPHGMLIDRIGIR